jgi:hypothetical protein
MQPALDAVARHHHQDLPASVAAPSLPPVRRPGRGRDRAGAGRVHLGGADSRLLRRRGVQSAFDEAQAGIRQRPGGPWQLCRVLRLGHHLDPIPAPLGRIAGHRQRTGFAHSRISWTSYIWLLPYMMFWLWVITIWFISLRLRSRPGNLLVLVGQQTS